MESKEDCNRINDTQDEFNEMILIDDNNNNSELKDFKNSNSNEEEEFITDEEYMLDCSRFGELENLKNLLLENPSVDINYTDGRKNNALRK